MLKNCLQMLVNQTYKNFEVYVLDRGSEPAVDYIVNELNDKRFTYIRSSQDVEANDMANKIFLESKGEYFTYMADDDGFTPSAFELVHKMFKSNEEIGIVQTSFIPFNQATNKQNISESFLTSYNFIKFTDENQQRFFEFDGKNIALYNFQDYGVGKKTIFPIPFGFHPGSMFLKRSVVLKTLEKQKELFIKPFGDAGYNGVAYHTLVGGINLPISILGVFHERETDSIQTNRKKWERYKDTLEYSPLKNSTFCNFAMELMLKVIYRNGLEKEYKPVIQKEFIYKRQLKCVLRDKTDHLPQKIKDLIEIYLYLGIFFILGREFKKLLKFIQGFDFRLFLKNLEKWFIRPFVLLVRFIRRTPKKPKPYLVSIEKMLTEDSVINKDIKEFESILEFADWVEETYVKQYPFPSKMKVH